MLASRGATLGSQRAARLFTSPAETGEMVCLAAKIPAGYAELPNQFTGDQPLSPLASGSLMGGIDEQPLEPQESADR